MSEFRSIIKRIPTTISRSHLVSARRRLRSPRNANHAPLQRLPSLLHARWCHGIRSCCVRTGPRWVWRYWNYWWLGFRSWLWWFHDVNFVYPCFAVFFLLFGSTVCSLPAHLHIRNSLWLMECVTQWYPLLSKASRDWMSGYHAWQ